MITTVGELVASLFDRYERTYGDPHLAAVATQHRVNDALVRSARLVAALKPHA